MGCCSGEAAVWCSHDNLDLLALPHLTRTHSGARAPNKSFRSKIPRHLKSGAKHSSDKFLDITSASMIHLLAFRLDRCCRGHYCCIGWCCQNQPSARSFHRKYEAMCCLSKRHLLGDIADSQHRLRLWCTLALAHLHKALEVT